MRKSGSGKVVTCGLALGLVSSGLLFTHHEAQAALGGDPYLLDRIDMSLGLEQMSGDITSSIGDEINYAEGPTENIGFTLSELEWPMDVLLARFDAAFMLSPYLRLNGTLKKGLNEPDDPLIDRDWLSSTGGVDLYSESSISEFDAFIADVDFEWVYLNSGPWNLYTGVGYMHQEFEYDGVMKMQYSPTGMYGTIPGNGTTSVNYDATFAMLYFLLGADVQLTPMFNLAGKFSVAPVASVEDELRHLYHAKVSTGDMEGSAYTFEVTGNFHLAPWWFVELGAQYTNLSVDGDQNIVSQGTPFAKIDQELESEQTSGYISMGYSF
jgi:hypothetical protein